MQPRRVLLVMALLAAPACKGSSNVAQSAARAPSRSGEVWEVDSAANRAGAPGALTAFVNGVHVILIDGDDAYAGSQSLRMTKRENGVRALQLANGSTAELTPAGEGLDLAFATGGHVRLHKQAAKAGGQ